MVRKTHLRGHQTHGEPARTIEAFPPTMTERQAFDLHDRLTVEFTQALKEGRCKRSTRFTHDLGATVAVLAPLVGLWNLEILFLLYMRGALRFSALKKALGGVSSRVLTDKLRGLAGEGLLVRTEAGSAVEYALTPKGETVARHLHPIVFYLRNRHDP